MSRNAKIILILLLAAVVLSAGFLLLQRKQVSSPVARITRDGELIREIPLDEVEESYSFVVEDTIQLAFSLIRQLSCLVSPDGKEWDFLIGLEKVVHLFHGSTLSIGVVTVDDRLLLRDRFFQHPHFFVVGNDRIGVVCRDPER